MKRIFLIRHAEPDFPGGIPLCMGRTVDLPLSAQGHRQAMEVAGCFPHHMLESIFTSPLTRCRQTAAPLEMRSGLKAVITDSLSELNGGLWDGLSLQTIRETYPEYFGSGSEKTPPCGESDEEGLARILPAMERLADSIKHCGALVTHAGIGRVLISHLTGVVPKRHIAMEYTGVTPLIFVNGIFKAETMPLNHAEFCAYMKERHLC